MSRRAFWEREQGSWPNRRLSRFVEAAGIRWHVQQAGSGPVVLLLHGMGASTHSWRDVLPILARHYTVLAVDLPGHAFTDAVSATGYSLAGMSASLGELLRVTGLSVAYGIGHSAGAAVLCRMALDRRIEPRRIVSINGAFLPLGGAASVIFMPIAKMFSASDLVSRMISWQARDAAAIERVILGTGSRLDARGLDLYRRLVREPCHVAGALGMMGNWNLLTFERELAALSAPLTLMVAGKDRAVPPRQARLIQSRVKGAARIDLPGLGHLAHEEAPAPVAELLLEALRAA